MNLLDKTTELMMVFDSDCSYFFLLQSVFLKISNRHFRTSYLCGSLSLTAYSLATNWNLRLKCDNNDIEPGLQTGLESSS